MNTSMPSSPSRSSRMVAAGRGVTVWASMANELLGGIANGNGRSRHVLRGSAGGAHVPHHRPHRDRSRHCQFRQLTGMVEVLFTNTEFLRTESDIRQRLAPAALSYCFAEGLLVQATMQHT